nr:MAG TPA: hypothetical protein [Caudoviricetes sp.]
MKKKRDQDIITMLPILGLNNMIKKVDLFDKLILKQFAEIVSVISTLEALLLLGVNYQISQPLVAIGVNLLLLIMVYVAIWWHANKLKKISITANKSTIEICFGDIFDEKDFKVIAFNEYFDTIVDDVIISSTSLNGIYLNKLKTDTIKKLDKDIESDAHLKDNIFEKNTERKKGKKIKYILGTIFKNDQFLLTAFSHFDKDNRAYLSMADFIGCLLKFWDEVDIKNSGHSISLPLLGSGITRLKEYIEITDQEILEIILWTFFVSRIKITHPAKLRIILSPSKIEKINLYKIQSLFNKKN